MTSVFPEGVRLVLLDMDGTLTPVKSPWQYVHESLGLWEGYGLPLLEAYLARDMDHETFCREDALVWSRHGVPLSRVRQLLEEIPVPEETVAFFAALRQAGLSFAIISTGFLMTARALLHRCGMGWPQAQVAANGLSEREGLIVPQLNVREDHPEKNKSAWSARFQQQFGCSPEQTAALGDSTADEPMFRASAWYCRVKGPEGLLSPEWVSGSLFHREV